jgi:guanylate cyclase
MPARPPTGLISRLAAIGYGPDDDPEARVRKATLSLTAATIALLASAWTLAYLALDRPVSAAIPLTYQIVAVASLIVLARTKRDGTVRVVHVGMILVLPVLLQWSLGGFANASAVIVWSFAAPLGALVFLSLPAALVTFLAFAGLVVLSGLLDPRLAAAAAPLPEAVILLFFVLDILGVSVVVFLALATFVRDRRRAISDLDRANRALQAEQADLLVEQARSASLLRNILPDAVAERLKGGDRSIADRHDAVTVLFADIVDFTPLAARLAASDLVLLLDRIFSALETLCERHGLEKIKTIGDSFMAVAGLPEPREAEEGAVAAARMAFDVLPAVRSATIELRDRVPGLPELEVRIGLHTGPVVAGVIGRRKFAYDLWGDAVNVASRMESQGLAGRIQVSLATWELLQRHYRARYRGSIEVKGHGEMGAYLLLGPRQPVGGGPAA